MDEFFAELRRLAWLVSGLLQHVKHLLCASSRMETMSADQLLTQARAVMTDNKGPTELSAASVRRTPSESKMRSDDRKFACYRCASPNHMTKDCLHDRQERSDSWMRKVRHEIRCFRCSGLASQCQGNAKGEEASASVSSPIN